ncbi:MULTISPECIES: acyl-CoA dehydrogenase family protein [unclassified Chelatococcus]|uniref:acyl-CoA dehydrogenase family protein n=1 Tax=unclassified Chelatococcus TaxID=2638111 RepID=UPI001BCB9FD0|nr:MULTISPECIES: acyl-CoA dehydrogenase family protein [unclassified Chelatococcus]MBS7743430.1 acyl-CoA/acyl-ACP dehydrogenase [Chelatococcus sp. HY11]MBX3547193.1 acyl-CoA/acyl-ACP dehydrogenase [Chelatococcus sp.]CAH1663886.1 Acyl-CoA dehydrogenase [Hyphomicrobiales bacterium]CAH1687961.1 Acyl-CoA dehydrogenase [Hyphomicrobiales bacterium]
MNFDLTEEQSAFRDMVRRWVDAEAPKSWCRELERDEENFPFALWDKMSEAGFHGIGIDEKYGGQGGDPIMQAIFAREAARNLAGLLWIWGPTSFAGGRAISEIGDEEQRQRFLPDIAAGNTRVTISFTEPGGGTDVLGAMRTFAEKVDGGWVINGEKIWSTGAHVADYLLVLARSEKNVEKRHHGLTVFFVPAKSKGITTTLLPKLGMRGAGSCTVHYDNVFVPDDCVLGTPGNAWKQVLPTLNNERILVGAQCLGAIDGVLEDAVEYAKQRKAFGRVIGSFQAIQHYIADIASWQKSVELLTFYTAWLQSQGRPCGVQSNMLKLVASEYAVKAADLGIQILGGMGYSAETDMQRYWRDQRILRIAPVTNEMVRNSIAESLGLPRSF